MRAWLGVCVFAVLGSAPGCASRDTASQEPARTERPDERAGEPGGRATRVCPGLDEAACRADDACQTVRGSLVEVRDAREDDSAATALYCLGPRAVIGCIASQECEEALTYFCDDRGRVYEVPDTCGPAGWTECAQPEPLRRSCE